MKARDVMVSQVVTAHPDLDVKAVAALLTKSRISAVPVVADGKVVGIVSEGDLVRRTEIGTEREQSWLDLITSERSLVADFVKSHARKVKDIMTSPVVTAAPDTPLKDVASLLERHGVKRLPILENGRLVGIVSRSNLVQVLASLPSPLGMTPTDETLRTTVVNALKGKPWGRASVNVVVDRGVVNLWGFVDTEDEKKAVRVAAESTPGVVSVADNLRVFHYPGGL